MSVTDAMIALLFPCGRAGNTVVHVAAGGTSIDDSPPELYDANPHTSAGGSRGKQDTSVVLKMLLTSPHTRHLKVGGDDIL